MTPSTLPEHGAKSLGDILKPGSEMLMCKTCSQPFQLPFQVRLVHLVTRCPACCDKETAAEMKRMLARVGRTTAEAKTAAWKQLCPGEYQNTDKYRLPYPSKLDLVLRWQFGPRGLLLHGPTGKGKSRCAWLLLKREHEAGRKIVALDSMLGFQYAAKFSESPAAVEAWISKLATVDLLFLDDVFKVKLTDSVEAALFAVVSQRTERQKPIIAAMNDTGRTLIERMSPDRGEPFVRRLREYCETIAFE